MDKVEMMEAVKSTLLMRLVRDNDFRADVCELIWEDLPIMDDDEEDAVVTKLFDECFDELSRKITVCLQV